METQSLEHIIYASAAAQDFSASQLAELLEKARVANEREGLTGMLLHTDSDGSFFQVLEGDPESIDRLLQKLKLDSIVHEGVAYTPMELSVVAAEQLIAE